MSDPYDLRLVVIPRDRFGGGYIGTERISRPSPYGPVAGFAEIDPNGLFASADEADALAAELCKRWNLHHELVEALSGVTRIAEAAGYTMQLAKGQKEKIEAAKAALAKADGIPR